MIYGIKQIEKQFPGFEARWAGGSVFDMTEMFVKEDMGPPGESHVDALIKEIKGNYWDVVMPPHNKMYICGGVRNMFSENTRYYEEYAVECERTNEQLHIKEMFVWNKNIKPTNPHLPNGMALRFRDIISDKSFIHQADDRNYKDIAFILGKKFADEYYDPRAKADLEEDMNDIISNVEFWYVISLFYLNIRNIKQKTSYVSQARSFYYPQSWGREYKVLSLSQTLVERSPGPDLPPGYHVRGHFQRGHFKRKKHGVYWWNPHWRGDFSKGIVMKDYKVKGA